MQKWGQECKYGKAGERTSHYIIIGKEFFPLLQQSTFDFDFDFEVFLILLRLLPIRPHSYYWDLGIYIKFKRSNNVAVDIFQKELDLYHRICNSNEKFAWCSTLWSWNICIIIFSGSWQLKNFIQEGYNAIYTF